MAQLHCHIAVFAVSRIVPQLPQEPNLELPQGGHWQHIGCSFYSRAWIWAGIELVRNPGLGKNARQLRLDIQQEHPQNTHFNTLRLRIRSKIVDTLWQLTKHV